MPLLLVFFAACNEKDELTNQSEKNLDRIRFFGVKNPDSSLRGSAQRDRLWYNGTTIKVKFLHDPYGKAEQIKQFVSEWEEHANIRFNFVDSGDALIRIGFDWNNDRYITWSYIGTDCKYVLDQSEATMSFADIRYVSESELRAEVLRTFGMALGLELEFRHSDMGGSSLWDEAYIRDYWSGNRGEIADIPWESLKKYVFDPLDEANRIETAEYDELSIMVWPFPRRYLPFEGYSENYDLSSQDIEFVKKLYPKEFVLANATVIEFPEPTQIYLRTEYGYNIADDSRNVKIAVDGQIIYEGDYASIPNMVECKVLEVEAEKTYLEMWFDVGSNPYRNMNRIHLTDQTEYTRLQLEGTELEEVILRGAPRVSGVFTFALSHKLKKIPDGIFDNFTEHTVIESVFSECASITTIPEDLFKNCVNLETINGTFSETNISAIPEGLFRNCTKMKNFEGVFMGCQNLTTIPDDLLSYFSDLETFNYTFDGSGITSIPEGIFDEFINLKEVYGAFARTGITSVPADLFKYNTELNTITWLFTETNISTIPEGLFRNCSKIKRVDYSFFNCLNLTNIPENLFRYNPLLSNVNSIFERCTSLQHIPLNIFQYNPNLTSTSGAFYGCTNADNYNSIPSAWK